MIAVLAKPTLEVLRSLFVGAVQVPWSQTARESTLALGWPDGRFSPIKVLVGSALLLVSSRYLARRGEESWALSKGPMINR